MARIKICGLKSVDDILMINKYKPDYVGFVFYPPSKRYVEYDLAKSMKSSLEKSIKSVGVFVDAPIEEIARLVNDDIIDIVQLHGKEDSEYITSLKNNIKKDVEIIKAFLIKDTSDIDAANKSEADYILLDNGYGTGEAFDWKLIKNVRKRFFLAGGLSKDNVSKALRLLNPYAVDASSNVETDGTKDENKVKLFCESVRRINKL